MFWLLLSLILLNSNVLKHLYLLCRIKSSVYITHMDITEQQAKQEIAELSALLLRYQHEYYVLNQPSVSDREFDQLFDRLSALEAAFPDHKLPNSPTARIGSDLSSDFPEVEHTLPVLSLDKAYSEGEVLAWIEKTRKNAHEDLSFFIEEKIDGVSIVLYYEEGVLARAVTRGNGYVGNDVTENVKTIGSVPLKLPKPVNVAVRGEIFIPLKDFQRINESLDEPYANPRNLAAGSLRRKISRETAALPLSIFVYEGFFNPPLATHSDVLNELGRLGFKLNPRHGLFAEQKEPESESTAQLDLFSGSDSRDNGLNPGDAKSIQAFYQIGRYIGASTDERQSLGYEIDGLVIKVNELSVREDLGYTGHHPRWALAYKFESPEGVTVIQKIDIQVGRTGRITPVARVAPVEIGGATVSNVTLHNLDYIRLLEVEPGDTVAVSRRGDVIPAVERVLEKGEESRELWHMPQECPECGTATVVKGAHHFCPNRSCPAQTRGALEFFVGRSQMDIGGIGPETLDVLVREKLVETIEDLYTCDYDSLIGKPGFGEKKVAAMKAGVAESLNQPYKVVLASLGIPELGQKAAELLIDAGVSSLDKLIHIVEKDDRDTVLDIHGIGEKMVDTIFSEFRRPELLEQLERLKRTGLNFEADAVNTDDLPDQIFTGQTWCVTGSFDHYKPRDKAMEEVKIRGGKVVTSVTGKTTHLLAGAGGGSKLAKAEKIGAQVLTEDEFLTLISDGRD